MARPKGSKNKEKVKLIEPVPIVDATVEQAQSLGRWTPAPDMGDIKEPPKAVLPCKDCGHVGEHHYGGLRNWCNHRGCNCQALQ